MKKERRRNVAAVLSTVIYISSLSLAPWFFSHQSCVMDKNHTYSVLNDVNCRMRFPAPDRSLEAYGAWFAAVFTSAALFWAYKGFSVQSETLRIQGDALRLQAEVLTGQQRELVLGSLSKEYKVRLEDAGDWALQELLISGDREYAVEAGGASTSSQVKLIFLLNMVKARKDQAEISELLQSSPNLQAYLSLAQDYNDLINRYDLNILRIGSSSDRAWVNIVRLVEELEVIQQGLGTAIQSEPIGLTPSRDRPP